MNKKFRVFSPKWNKFLDEDSVQNDSHYYNIFTNKFETWDSYYRGDLDDCVLLMGTGIKDFSGEEIFEGYEIQGKRHYVNGIITGVVILNNGSFCLKKNSESILDLPIYYQLNELVDLKIINKTPKIA